MTHFPLNHIRVFLELIFVAYKLELRIETRRSFTTGNSEFVLFSTSRSVPALSFSYSLSRLDSLLLRVPTRYRGSKRPIRDALQKKSHYDADRRHGKPALKSIKINHYNWTKKKASFRIPIYPPSTLSLCFVLWLREKKRCRLTIHGSSMQTQRRFGVFLRKASPAWWPRCKYHIQDTWDYIPLPWIYIFKIRQRWRPETQRDALVLVRYERDRWYLFAILIRGRIVRWSIRQNQVFLSAVLRAAVRSELELIVKDKLADLLWQGIKTESKSNVDLLQLYAKEWDKYLIGANYIDRLFSYLNSHWSLQERQKGRRDVYTVYKVWSILTLFEF